MGTGTDERRGRVVHANPPARCDICASRLGRTFYDVVVPRARMWGSLCHACFLVERCTLGTGRGQRFERLADSVGPYVKTGG